MLQFILGKNGSGKTRRAVNIISDLCKKGEKKLIMLVPDQSSFDTETAILEKLGPELSGTVHVFGFSRLCNYVFKNTGKTPENVIDDGIRKIIMSKALDEVSDKLEIFSSSKTKKSVLDLMVNSYKEYMIDNITPKLLETTAQLIENDTLKMKLSETSLIISAYEALLKNTYVDPLENLNRLKDILEAERLFEGYTVVVDSFSDFTYQQLEIIRLLIVQSKDFYITLNIDMEYKNTELFSITNRTRKLIKRIAEQNGVEIKPPIVLNEFKRSKNEDISFLEKNIFRVTNEFYNKESENIETYTASDINDEVNFVAGKIKRLIYDKKFRYKDIAVVCRDISKYNGALDAVFTKLNIPFFMSTAKDIFTKPVVRFISGAIDTVISGFDRDNLLSMLKTGLLDIDDTDIADFENYIFIWNVDRSDFKKEFKNNPSGFEVLKDSDIVKLEKIENTRKYVIDPLIEFAEKCKNTDGLTISKAVYGLLEVFDIEKSIDRLYDKLESEGLIFEANEEVRVYNLVIEALENLVAAVGDDKLSLKKYKEYFDYKLADIKLSDIPQYQDQVNIAVADLARLNDTKAVFILGAVDGEFPAVHKASGVFTENERRILIENNIPLSDTQELYAGREKYLIYCALTSTEDKLFISTHYSDYEGNIYEPSVIFTEIERLFPNRGNSDYYVIDKINSIYTKRQAFEYMAKGFSSDSVYVNSLKSYFSADDEYKDAYKKLENTLNEKPFEINDKDIAESLFGKNMKISASRVEKYNLCAFQYFCNYGLKARERKAASIDAIQFGNIVHWFLEKFLIKNDKAALNTLSDEDIKNDIDSILLEYAEINLGGIEDKTESFKTLFERLKINTFTLTKELIRQLMYSDFIPAAFELKIGDDGEIPAYKVKIDDDRSVSVNGYIDRVDTFEKNEKEKYIRIVDYKTGNKVFKLYEILYGINLQMLLYLKCVSENGEDYFGSGLIPAGVLYMPSAAKDIDGDKYSDKEKITAQLDNNFKMNGLVLNDEELLNHMDRSGKFIKLSKKTEEGQYSDSLATNDQFKLIFGYIDEIVRNMGEELLSGNIEAAPIKGIVDGCAYCPYDSVCNRTYDEAYRFRTEASPNEVYKVIDKGDENDG